MTSTLIANASYKAAGKPGLFSHVRLDVALLWLTFALSGIVWIEPAPFDLLCLLLIGMWLVRGMRLTEDFRLPLILLGVLSVTGLVGAIFSDVMLLSVRHIVITVFLYLITIGLAAHVARDPESALNTIVSGYTVAALIAVLAGTIGYFSSSEVLHEIFTERERARGTFKDPNVFGPFLVLPAVYCVLLHIKGQCRFGGWHTGAVAFLCLGLLLSFSRGAWGNFALSLALSVYLLFVSSNSNALRARVVLLTALAVGLIVAGGLFALSFDAVAEMMSVRGKLIQSYDTQERFHGADIAIDVILKHPLGIGAVGFERFHDAEPHNVYLYSFLIGGWLGGFAYIALVCMTMFMGVQAALTKSNFQLIAIAFATTFIATVLEGLIVDTDHWRHFYVLMAGIWGMRSYLLFRDRERRLEPVPLKVDEAPTRRRIAPVQHAVARRQRSSFVAGPQIQTELEELVSHPDVSPVERQPCAVIPDLQTKTPVALIVAEMRQHLCKRERQLAVQAAARRKEEARTSNEVVAVEMPADEERDVFGQRDSETLPVRSTFGRRNVSEVSELQVRRLKLSSPER